MDCPSPQGQWQRGRDPGPIQACERYGGWRRRGKQHRPWPAPERMGGGGGASHRVWGSRLLLGPRAAPAHLPQDPREAGSLPDLLPSSISASRVFSGASSPFSPHPPSWLLRHLSLVWLLPLGPLSPVRCVWGSNRGHSHSKEWADYRESSPEGRRKQEKAATPLPPPP